MADEDLTRIENLKRRMYSRETEQLRGVREHKLYQTDEGARTDWEHGALPKVTENARRSPLKIFLSFSVVFFLVAAGYAAYLYFGGSNVVSSANIGVSIAGPVSIRGGEKLSLEIAVENRNATPLEVADLLVEFPDGTRNPEDLSKELLRTREGLGDVASGAVIKKNISAVLFGEERAVKDIKLTIEYRVPGSNAIFYKESSYQVVISSAPLSVVVEAPKEANSGQDMTLTVTVSSNSTDTVQGVLLKADYPSGFSFKSATPKPSKDDRIWKLGDIKSGSTRTFTIRGSLSGENLDTRVFRFEIGIASTKDDTVIATPFSSITEEISIAKPFIGLSIAANGSSDDKVAISSGKPVRIDLSYVNNLLVPVSNVEITLVLSGSALDKTSVTAESGFYRSVDNTIIWNKSTNQKLSLIPPGEGGTVSVTLASIPLSGGVTNLRNPEIFLAGSVKGQRNESGSVPESVISSVKRTLQIQSDVALSSRLLYYSGPFKNTGPMPPKAEKETTYTVVMTITNGSNDLNDVIVTAPLPSYVRFIQGTAEESISFSAVGGMVTWNVGALKAGTGFGSFPKQASFQIGFIPSVSQIGKTPVLVNSMILSGTDRFTNTSLKLEQPALNTRLTSDASAKQADDIVVK